MYFLDSEIRHLPHGMCFPVPIPVPAVHVFGSIPLRGCRYGAHLRVCGGPRRDRGALRAAGGRLRCADTMSHSVEWRQGALRWVHRLLSHEHFIHFVFLLQKQGFWKQGLWYGHLNGNFPPKKLIPSSRHILGTNTHFLGEKSHFKSNLSRERYEAIFYKKILAFSDLYGVVPSIFLNARGFFCAIHLIRICWFAVDERYSVATDLVAIVWWSDESFKKYLEWSNFMIDRCFFCILYIFLECFFMYFSFIHFTLSIKLRFDPVRSQ